MDRDPLVFLDQFDLLSEEYDDEPGLAFSPDTLLTTAEVDSINPINSSEDAPQPEKAEKPESKVEAAGYHFHDIMDINYELSPSVEKHNQHKFRNIHKQTSKHQKHSLFIRSVIKQKQPTQFGISKKARKEDPKFEFFVLQRDKRNHKITPVPQLTFRIKTVYKNKTKSNTPYKTDHIHSDLQRPNKLLRAIPIGEMFKTKIIRKTNLLNNTAKSIHRNTLLNLNETNNHYEQLQQASFSMPDMEFVSSESSSMHRQKSKWKLSL